MDDEYFEPLATDEKVKSKSQKRRISRIPNWLKLLIGIVIILFGIFWYWEYRPQYIMFDIPEYDNIYWSNEEKGTITHYAYSGDKIWVWRIAGKCWENCDGEIIAFFDTFLTEENWHRTEYPTGGYSLPECGGISSSSRSDFLEIVMYVPDGQNSFSHACLHIYQDANQDYSIVFSTYNSSPITDVLNRPIDLNF
jgi:hypothetical protein